MFDYGLIKASFEWSRRLMLCGDRNADVDMKSSFSCPWMNALTFLPGSLEFFPTFAVTQSIIWNEAVNASPWLSTLRTLGAVVCPKLLMTGGSKVERGYPGMGIWIFWSLSFLWDLCDGTYVLDINLNTLFHVYAYPHLCHGIFSDLVSPMNRLLPWSHVTCSWDFCKTRSDLVVPQGFLAGWAVGNLLRADVDAFWILLIFPWGFVDALLIELGYLDNRWIAPSR